MNPRPCYRNLDRPIVALWGLEPVDLFAIFASAVVLMIVTNIIAIIRFVIIMNFSIISKFFFYFFRQELNSFG